MLVRAIARIIPAPAEILLSYNLINTMRIYSSWFSEGDDQEILTKKNLCISVSTDCFDDLVSLLNNLWCHMGHNNGLGTTSLDDIIEL